MPVLSMPIRPEMLARYPGDWPQIRAKIKARAGNVCENCGVPNYAYRIRSGKWSMDADVVLCMAEDVREKPTKIVCTVAHLNHTPEDCRSENLRFWCQKCHLAYDLEHHQQNAYQTRRRGKAIEMFP